MNRRVFLRGIGGVALAAPFLPSVFEKKAKAQGTTVTTPKRLVIHFTHNGCLTDRWWPKVSTYTNGAAALTADMLKGQTLEPLTPYINKVTIPRGFRSMNCPSWPPKSPNTRGTSAPARRAAPSTTPPSLKKSSSTASARD